MRDRDSGRDSGVLGRFEARAWYDFSAVHVAGSRAFVGDMEWVRVLEVATPSAPRALAAYETSSSRPGEADRTHS
jgi:hypothetical protein